MAYPICGTITTKFLPNSVSIDEYKILHCKKWNIDISTSSMCKMYIQLHCRDRISLSKLRCANSKLTIYKHIYIHDSDVCTVCNLNVCGDE